MRFGFTKADRIRSRRGFVELSAFGRRIHTRLFIAMVAGGSAGRSRLGITVTRRVAGAVHRNRIKRRVREFFRLNRHLFVGGHLDINVIAKREAAGASGPAVFAALQELFEKAAQLDH